MNKIIIKKLFEASLKLNNEKKSENLTVCYYHVTYAFQSESTFYSCLNVKELLARNRCDIWSLSNSNGIWTHNHLVQKRALKNLEKLAKWLSCVMSTYLCIWLYVIIMSQIYTLQLPVSQLDKQITKPSPFMVFSRVH